MAKNASQPLTYEQALQRAAALCSSSEHCISDINEKLYKWGIPKKESESIINTLIDGKYIDEARYASAYTNDKIRFSHWGRIKIRSMLRLKHISDSDIENAFSTINQEEYEQILKDIIENKSRSIGNDVSYISRSKIIRFALQRGFEMHEITKFVTDF